MYADLIIKNAREVVTPKGKNDRPAAGSAMSELEVIPGGFVASRGDKIVAVGPSSALGDIETDTQTKVIDAAQGVVIPGLVDPHTHLLFAGGREDEFHMRIDGLGYMEIGRRGGGIGRTVRETRAVGRKGLAERGIAHMWMMALQGTTTVEIKSGYGLSTESEMEMLSVIREISGVSPMGVVSTFLGAHAVPAEFKGQADAFIDLVVEDMLPKVVKSGLATFCDVFCEDGAFTVEQSRRVLAKAAELGMPLKIHGEELANSGGVRLAAELKAVSVDHCNFVSQDDLGLLKKAGTIAVALPATPFFLLAPRYAPARGIIEAGVPLAIATDYNPTASISSMLFVMFLSCLNMKMTPSEVLVAATINAAHALKKAADVGSLEVGKDMDALIMRVDDFRKIPFYVGRSIIDSVVCKGRVVS
ncbi:MAG: imidazolonepropionase [Hyphomicrobiales bacterium]|nr:imidazolonepropionase [Hyphomicrobiales bacterium]